MNRVYILSGDDSILTPRIGLMDLESNQQIEAMSHCDFFLVNGCSISDEKHAFDFVLGNFNLYAFDHQKITFTKVDY